MLPGAMADKPPPPQEQPDEDLLAAARRGDLAAKEALLLQWLPGLREFVRSRMSPLLRTKLTTEDLLQSSCRELLAAIPEVEYRGADAYRGWLFTAVLNKVKKSERDLRAARRDPRRERPLDAAPSGAMPTAGAGTPLQAAVGKEREERLQAAIAELPEDFREVLSLARLAQLPRAEIAQRMGRSEAAVRSLLTRALQALAARLASDHSSQG